MSEFKRNASKFVKQVQETKQSVVLTVNGQAVAVLQDAESYQSAVTEREMAESVEILKQRIAKIRNGGKLIPADEVFARIAKKYDISLD